MSKKTTVKNVTEEMRARAQFKLNGYTPDHIEDTLCFNLYHHVFWVWVKLCENEIQKISFSRARTHAFI